MKILMSTLNVALLLSLPGCMNIAASLQPEDASVQEIRESSDCVPIIFGFAYGRATLEGALSEAVPTIESMQTYSKVKVKPTPQTLSKIRRVQLHDYQVLMFGARCVEVVGE